MTGNEDVPDWAMELAEKQDEMSARLAAILAKIDGVTGDIKPMVDALSKSPMMKMLGVKL